MAIANCVCSSTDGMLARPSAISFCSMAEVKAMRAEHSARKASALLMIDLASASSSTISP